MDFKKKLRAFFTLTRKSDGFTLVELVVVIAILGILGGVAVPAYSGYITKTNETADRQMIGDIEHALTLGAYSGRYTPGVVGAVGISKDEAATAVNSVEGATDIEDMMVQAFGESWEEALKLKSDYFANSDAAQMIEAIKNNPDLFASVAGSSFYASEGGTASVVGEVDDLATALNKVLGKLSANLDAFWGESFAGENGALSSGGITSEMWKNDDQMAANLSVFAVASEVANNPDRISDWKSNWTTGGTTTVSSTKGYVADLAMQYAKCVAYMNYAEQNYGSDRKMSDVNSAYKKLQNTMKNMDQDDPQNRNELQRFNDAITEFWNKAGSYTDAWQSSGQAAKDADAFIASMTAVNTLEDAYVSKDKIDVLQQGNAFATAGAADILDAMISYAELSAVLPENVDYLLVLKIDSDGTPKVSPTLKEE